MNADIRDFAGGINVFAHPLFAPKDSLARATNIDLSWAGAARLRAGLAKPSGWPGAWWSANGDIQVGDASETFGTAIRALAPIDFRFGTPPTVAQEEA